MPTRDELYTALRNADKAGDTEGARKLAAYIQAQPADDAAPTQSGPLKFKTAAPNSPDSLPGRLAAGAALGVADIGRTVLNAASHLPLPEAAQQFIRTKNADFDALTEANKDSTAFKLGRVGGNVAATLPVGGALAQGLSKVPVLASSAAPLISAVRSGGFTTGLPAATTLAGKAAQLGIRSAGGAITGGASAALVDPNEALSGAVIGGALPGVAKVVGVGAQAVGNKLLSMLRGGAVSPEVAQLATRAGELGIDVPADRIANSRPLNALAASLNYVPLSGRAATERTMQDQLNRALSRTFGQNDSNVTGALRAARGQLGDEFDRVLQGNQVHVDAPFLDALAQADQRAQAELGSDGARVIRNQIGEIMSKGAGGAIDGQAAYNIKRTLDRIGKRNSPEAFYASDLRRDLMDALNRSLTPEGAAAFATTRKQYGNMLSLEKLAQNGVDGDVSIARLANMKNIGNNDLQELADISAQFLKAREGQHGAAQRVGIGGLMTMLGGAPGLAAGMAAGRATNTALNSNALKGLIMGQPVTAQNRLLELIASPEAQQLGYRSAPLMQRD